VIERRALFVKRLLALLLAASAGGFAEAAPGASPCKDDARQLCASVQPGGGRAVACLKEHEAELSASCKAALPTLERCSAEVRSLCGTASAPRELRSCLRSNAAKLSPECRQALPAR
jgi:Cysteine rich repeat